MYVQDIVAAVDRAKALDHPLRAMRVTMECAHIRLMPWINTGMGIGAYTSCRICPSPDGKDHVSRQVVNVEETGVLHESWFEEHAKGA